MKKLSIILLILLGISSVLFADHSYNYDRGELELKIYGNEFAVFYEENKKVAYIVFSYVLLRNLETGR